MTTHQLRWIKQGPTCYGCGASIQGTEKECPSCSREYPLKPPNKNEHLTKEEFETFRAVKRGYLIVRRR